MKNHIANFLTSGIEENDISVRRLTMTTNALLFITSSICFLALILNWLVFYRPILAILDFIATIVSLIAIIDLKKNQALNRAIIVGSANLFFLFIAFSYSNESTKYGLIWTIFFPIFVITLMGHKKGLLLTGLFYLVLFSMAYYKIGIWDNGAWDNRSFFRVLLASSVLTYIVYVYEVILFQSNVEIKNTRAKEVAYLEELQTIFDFAQDGIAILSLDTKFLNFNTTYLLQTGFEKEELLGMSCLDLTTNEDKQKSKDAIAKVMIDGSISGFEKVCVQKDGAKMVVNMSIALMPDKQRLLITTKDMTQQKRFDEQNKLASMGELIGNIAHQWRQPLSVISTIASGIALKKEYDNLNEADIIPNMEHIVERANYLSKTIDDFRNLSQVSTAETIINLSSLFDRILSLEGPILNNSHIQVIANIDSNATTKGFENELMQAIIHIINNSRDAINEKISKESPRYLFITVGIKNKNVEIIFKDNAGGIDETIIKKIFEPYFTTKHQSVGTGLGLSMAYKTIAHQHQGSIEASNKEYEYEGKQYKGACFRMLLKTI